MTSSKSMRKNLFEINSLEDFTSPTNKSASAVVFDSVVAFLAISFAPA